MKKFRHYVLLLVTAMAVFGCSKDNDDTESNQDIKVESVALADQSVVKGSTVKLEPTFTPATATNKNVTWTSSKPGVATIAANGTVTGVAEGETTITVTTTDGGFTATCKITVGIKTIVGDFYYSDGTHSAEKAANKTVIGIVFWEDSDNAGHGKIVSLNEEVDVVWSTEQIETNANSMNNGAENTNKIKSISEYETKYPAVAWCVQKGAGWYLPAPYELVALYTAWNVDQIMFNKKLTDAQGTAIASDRYWDSYEFSESNGTQYNFAIGDMDRAPKSVKYRVRAILAF